MENSIEEAIERLEYIDRAYSCNNYYSVYDLKCIEILLSDYKRVLKENEELLELKVSASAHNRILELEKENKNLKATNKDLQKSVDMIYADYQDIGNKAFEYSDKIEQLQKENEELKAKLEYKQYGDLDNIEFEKYINDIVKTRTKELKEQLEEEQELNKIIKETRINKILENNIEVKKLREENEELKADNLEYQRIQDLSDKRTYRKKYLEERRKEEPNLLYPDSDEIYQRYYELKEQFANSIPISKLKEEVLNPMKEGHDKAIKGFISTDAPECGIYSTIAQELGYFIGKIEELIDEEGNK